MEGVRFCSTRPLFTRSDTKFSSVYLHDTREGQQQDVKIRVRMGPTGVITRASFRRLPRNGKSFFTTTSLHINNQFAKKRGIGKKLLLTIRAVMLEERVYLVAGDFNGAAWRRPMRQRSKTHQRKEEAFADTDLPMPPGSIPLWRPGAVPGGWADVCGFLKPPDSHEKWKVRLT